MGDLIRALLTGVFRDKGNVSATTQDPTCEAQFIDLDDPEGTPKTAEVRFANDNGCPWYAAMAHFFGTLRCTTGSMTVDGLTLRTYTVNSGDETDHVATIGERIPEGIGTVCLRIPANASFHAIVMGRTVPNRGDEALPTPGNVLTAGGMGPIPVSANSWCRLVFVAADGSNYGSAMDGTRWVMGYYPRIENNLSGAPGQDSGTQDNLNKGQPVLPYGSNVVLVARRYNYDAENLAYNTRFCWHIAPGEAPACNVVIARYGTDDWGNAYTEFDTTQTYARPYIVAWDPVQEKWRKASVVPTTYPVPPEPDHSAKSFRTVLGICIGSNGSNGASALGQRHIVTEGRFWINPALYPLLANTPYYIAATASEQTPTTTGLWSEVPGTLGCRRVAFFHHIDGWCTVGPQFNGISALTPGVVSIAKITAQDVSLSDLVTCELYPNGRTVEGGDITWTDVPVRILQIRAGSNKLPVNTWLIVTGTPKIPFPDPPAEDATDYNWYTQPPIWM